MKSSCAKRERGAALLALLAVLTLGSSWYLVSQLNAESGMVSAARKARNAEVLNRAKLALIGYVAAQAANLGEDNPGSLPCPEAAGYFDNPGQEGQTASSCTLPKVGRFPWRTIGTEKLVDSAGEPLWYVVSPGWAATSGGFKTNINSNTPGQLTVDGTANAAVALIIAPGPAFSVPACGINAAFNQTRPTIGTPDWRNYLECENATYPTPDSTFVTNGASGSFNDQVVRVTAADIMPGIEAAIAKRIERSIVPELKTVFTPTTWGFVGVPATFNPVLPFAAPFASPGSGAGTSNYRGATATYAGLLPFNQTQGCTESAADPRCTTATTGGTAFLVFSKSGNDVQTAGGGSIRTQSSCGWQSTTFVCTGEYLNPTISVTVTINVTNVAMGLRALDLSLVTCTAVDDVGNGIPTQTVPCTTSIALQSNGSAVLTVATGAMPDISASGWGTYANYMVNVPRAVTADHRLLNPVDPPSQTPAGACPATGCTGWFVRNEWYRLVYYAASRSNTTALLPAERSCATAADCLTVTNMNPSNDKSALLILAGRSVNGVARPTATLADYLESGNATGAYTRNTISAATAIPSAQRFNDRVVVFGSN